MILQMYQAQRISHSEFVPIRNLPYHVRVWGEPAPGVVPWVMVHGWMDVSASYQFVVDALCRDQYIIAPDWRGYGQTPGHTGSGPSADNFWFPDYMADLDFLIDHYAPDAQVDLIGHSMGGTVAMMYAGVRPARIRRLVNLEGFGMPATTPDQAPGRCARWMDELKQLHRGELDLKTYDSADGVARRLMKTNPRLGADKALWLAPYWARKEAEGQWRILGEPAHKISNAQLYRVDEVEAIFRRISMPVLCVEALSDSLAQWWKGKYTLEQFHQRLQAVPQVQIASVENAGHMLHHDQPEILASLIERFLD